MTILTPNDLKLYLSYFLTEDEINFMKFSYEIYIIIIKIYRYRQSIFNPLTAYFLFFGIY